MHHPGRVHRSSRQHVEVGTEDCRLASLEQWLCRPLCRRYDFAGLLSVRLPVRSGDVVGHISWIWTLGLFKSVQYEVLGAWPARTTAGCVASSLHCRGVEHIGAIHADEGIEVQASLCDAFTCLLDQHRHARSLGDSPAIGRRRNAALRSAVAATLRLRARVDHVIASSSPFPEEAAAAAFLAETLRDTDRRLFAA